MRILDGFLPEALPVPTSLTLVPTSARPAYIPLPLPAPGLCHSPNCSRAVNSPRRICEACYMRAAISMARWIEIQLVGEGLSPNSGALAVALERASLGRLDLSSFQVNNPFNLELTVEESRKLRHLTDIVCAILARGDQDELEQLQAKVEEREVRIESVVVTPDETRDRHWAAAVVAFALLLWNFGIALHTLYSARRPDGSPTVIELHQEQPVAPLWEAARR